MKVFYGSTLPLILFLKQFFHMHMPFQYIRQVFLQYLGFYLRSNVTKMQYLILIFIIIQSLHFRKKFLPKSFAIFSQNWKMLLVQKPQNDMLRLESMRGGRRKATVVRTRFMIYKLKFMHFIINYKAH